LKNCCRSRTTSCQPTAKPLVGSSAKKIDLNFKELKMLNSDLLLTVMYS
jgi:hypothetical protein